MRGLTQRIYHTQILTHTHDYGYMSSTLRTREKRAHVTLLLGASAISTCYLIIFKIVAY